MPSCGAPPACAGAADEADLLDQRAVRRIRRCSERLRHLIVRAEHGSSSPCRYRRNGPWRRARACRAGIRSRPARARRRRSSTSMNSSAGTAKNTISPARCSAAPDCRQPHRDAEHAGDLGVVAAAMRRAGVRVGERVVGGAQAVELAEQARGAGRACRREPALDAGQREAGLRREAECRASSRRPAPRSWSR